MFYKALYFKYRHIGIQSSYSKYQDFELWFHICVCVCECATAILCLISLLHQSL